VDEPYRMFTSRAEYRILLRQDNADERLTEKGYSLGLVSQERLNLFRAKQEATNQLTQWLKKTSLSPEDINAWLVNAGTTSIDQKTKAVNIVARPQVRLSELISLYREELSEIVKVSGDRFPEITEAAEIAIKYSGYIEREKVVADKIKRLEGLTLPSDIEYETLTSISTEARQKLSRIRPVTIGQASRISGVSPSDISILLLYLGR
jgi:tRNA uridine 5-carboxymethylaminomethyl modification enzyme